MRQDYNMATDSKRLNILSKHEVKEIFGFPRFTPKDRDFYISLNEEEMKVVEKFKTTKTKIHFILLASYFKATGTFHDFEFQNVKRDTNYVLNKYFNGKKIQLKGSTWRNTRFEQRKLILELYEYQQWDESAISFFHLKLLKLLRIHANHIDVFKESLELIKNQRIVLPPYRILQDCLTRAISEEKERLKRILDKKITLPLKTQLNRMLDDDDSVSNLSFFKIEAKNFNKREMSKEVKKCEEYKDLYLLAKDIIPKLEISGHATRQYAEQVEQMSLFRLRQMKSGIARLYLLCFIYSRFQQTSDNLVVGFIYHVAKFDKLRKEHAKEKLLKFNLEQNEVLPGVSRLLMLMVNDKYPEKFYYQDFLDTVAYPILPRERFVSMANYINGKGFDRENCKWDFCSMKSGIFKANIRQLFININFGSNSSNVLLKAVEFLKLNIINKKSLNQIPFDQFPAAFIPDNIKKYIKETIQLKNGETLIRYNADKYEYLVYQQIVNHLDHDELFCNDTQKNKSLKDDLLSEESWKNKDEILQQIEYKNIAGNIKERLNLLERKLDTKITEVNNRISQGENKEFKIKVHKKSKKETWSLDYRKQSKPNRNIIFHKLPKTNIADVLYYINDKCNYLKAFTHIKPKYSKLNVNEDALIAAITANAFSSGINQMAEMSNIKYTTYHSQKYRC